MKIEIVNEADGITKLELVGSLDIEGTLAVDPQFTELSKTKDKIVVDLKGVDFLASLGMRTLVSTAKTLMQKGGRLVLINPQAGVEKAIKSAGIDTIIQIAPDMKSAISLFR
jgi:anti-anti-sigma factor